ncbi:MAG: antibiotic biosynthesis monooxygenase [Acidimicrobiales bacterium]
MEVVLFKVRTRPDIDAEAYEHAFGEMLEKVSAMPGFIGIDGYAGEDGSELAVARFESKEAVEQWRDDPDHVRTRARGHTEFFDAYEIIVATAWRQYDWSRGDE